MEVSNNPPEAERGAMRLLGASSAVAEFTVAAILMETRLMRAGHESLRQGQWRAAGAQFHWLLGGR